MDFTTIEANKNITIFQPFAGNVTNSSWGDPINNVSFIPDYMIIKSIYYVPAAGDSTAIMYFIYSDLIGDYIGNFTINSITNGAVVSLISIPTCPNQIYKLNKPIMGEYNFTITQDTAGTVPTLNGKLVINIELIKLKAVKPQKTY